MKDKYIIVVNGSLEQAVTTNNIDEAESLARAALSDQEQGVVVIYSAYKAGVKAVTFTAINGTPIPEAVHHFIKKPATEQRPRANRRWSAREISDLSALVRAGKSVPEISLVLGRSKTAVHSKKCELGLSVRAARRRG